MKKLALLCVALILSLGVGKASAQQQKNASDSLAYILGATQGVGLHRDVVKAQGAAATKEYWDVVKAACDKWDVDYLDFFEGSTNYNGEIKTYSELFDVDGNTYLWSGQGKIPKLLREVMQRDGITDKNHYLIK